MTASTSNNNKDTSPRKRKTWARGRKRRLLPKDGNAPKGPFTGYMMFVNEQREALKSTDAKLGFQEFNKSMAQKWAQLNAEEKKKYLDASEVDKVRFEREMEAYKKTDSYKNFLQKHKEMEKQKAKEAKKAKDAEKDSKNICKVTENEFHLEVPIFTEEFLKHNKVREGEIRQLRKSTLDFEEQNVVLHKHIESIQAAVNKLEGDLENQKTKNSSLQSHLDTLRKSLCHAFAQIAIPDTNEKPTEESIEEYISALHNVLTAQPQQHQKLSQTVKQIVNNLANNL